MPTLAQFYLVGGTALALQLGHRFSVDLDLFTVEPFDSSSFLPELQTRFECTIQMDEPSLVMANLSGVKVDFVKMGYPILFPINEVDGVRMLDIRDIGAMKLKAIVQRGSKKDFFDIYYLLQQIPLKSLFEYFSQKFRQHEMFHVVKSLVYFADAELNPDPSVFDKTITWDFIKASIRQEVNEL